MPHCENCRTELEKDAHFCRGCENQVASMYPPPAPSKSRVPSAKDPVIIAVIILVSILIVGVIVISLFAISISNLNFDQSYQDNTVNVNRLNFSFQSSAARINVFTQKLDNNNFVISIKGSASKNPFRGDTDSPIQISFYNDTINGVETVQAKLEESTAFSRYDVVCDIYVNPALTVNLTVTSQSGEISLIAETPISFVSINLNAAAGAVHTSLQNATILGNMTFRTQAGTVDFHTNQIRLMENSTASLNSNAGSVNIDMTQTESLQGNLKVEALTDLGSVNVVLSIDNDVAAKITSQTALGSIHTDLQNFSGNKSPVQSDNYPASSNIEIDCRTNLGSVNLNADYQSSAGLSLRN